MNLLQKITKNKHFKKYLIISFFAVSALLWLGFTIASNYWVNTDDAYVNANIVLMAARINGQVVRVNIKENDYVHKDDVLVIIDPEPFQIAVDAATANVMSAQAELVKASHLNARATPLVQQKFLSAQEGDNATAAYQAAQGALLAAKAKLAEAKLNLKYTQISAPTDGWIAQFDVRDGEMVTANQPLFALISDGDFWIDANFKETELQGIQVGQKAEIKVDMYPGYRFSGVVESLSGGAGAAFSLLPPQNATGNWVKVTQRIPVRVHVLELNKQYPLRVGSSAQVTIYKKDFVKATP